MLINHSKTLKAGLDFSEKRTLCSKKHLRFEEKNYFINSFKMLFGCTRIPRVKRCFLVAYHSKKIET